MGMEIRAYRKPFRFLNWAWRLLGRSPYNALMRIDEMTRFSRPSQPNVAGLDGLFHSVTCCRNGR